MHSDTDASIEVLGAVLEQEQDNGTLHPVAYASRSLSKAERNYGITGPSLSPEEGQSSWSKRRLGS